MIREMFKVSILHKTIENWVVNYKVKINQKLSLAEVRNYLAEKKELSSLQYFLFFYKK